MDEPAVSISCITYNHEPYIRDCLEGFLMQKTNFPFEILIHDDASTDKTADIIREYEAKYPDVIKPIYQTENQYSKGVKVSLVYNYPRAKGKYIALCEGDDFWTDPDKLQIQYDFMEANPDYSLCGCRSSHINMIKKTYCLAPLSPWWNPENQKLLDGLPLWSRPFDTATFFFRVSCYQTKKELFARDSEKMSFGDVQLILHLSHCGKIGLIDKDMVTYRIAKNSAIGYGDPVQRKQRQLRAFADIIRLSLHNDMEMYIPNVIEAYASGFVEKKSLLNRMKSLFYTLYSKCCAPHRRYCQFVKHSRRKNMPNAVDNQSVQV